MLKIFFSVTIMRSTTLVRKIRSHFFYIKTQDFQIFFKVITHAIDVDLFIDENLFKKKKQKVYVATTFWVFPCL